MKQFVKNAIVRIIVARAETVKLLVNELNRLKLAHTAFWFEMGGSNEPPIFTCLIDTSYGQAPAPFALQSAAKAVWNVA